LQQPSQRATAGRLCASFALCSPDIVLTELVMPEKDGIELLLEIKRTAPQTKVIAMSGGGGILTSEFVLQLARRLGADGIVSKPIDGQRLLEVIDATLFPQADD
jgi:DNA-binding NarL/FixJ family response regulator